MSIVFVTPGLLDIRAFTVLGMHAKPNSTNPIGRFGTGLKNAVAVLIREGVRVRVFIGRDEYEFYKSPEKFRGADFDMIRMKKKKGIMSKWTYEKLPFTTSFARYWQLWQAFRELHSNTLDEGGETYALGPDEENVAVGDNRTTIWIDGPAFDEVYANRDTIFLPGALTKREGDDKVQVFNEPSKHLYWRGMRVFDLEKPSIYTYNILQDMELTEDRTLKHVWSAQSIIAGYVARSKDQRLINAVVGADKEKFFEGRMDWDYTYVTPSDSFKEVIRKKRSRGSYVGPAALSFYDRYTPAPVVAEKLGLMGQIEYWAYQDDKVPEKLRDLLKHLLKCKIEEPSVVIDDGEIPF